jgi:hypothetical protein
MIDYNQDIKIAPNDPALNQRRFRQQLAHLLDRFLSDGGDPWWMNQELNLAGMQVLDDLRCDLIVLDEEGGEGP